MATIKLEIQADNAADLATAVLDVAAAVSGAKPVAHTPAPKAAAPAPAAKPAAAAPAKQEEAKAKAPEQSAFSAEEKKASATSAPAGASEAAQTDGKAPTQADFQEALMKVMKKHSAAKVQQILEETCGTKVPPQVKAADYAKAIAALNAVL